MGKTCLSCGAKTVYYRHTLSKALMDGLYKLYRLGGQRNLAELNLTRNQWDNFQKLRYWCLVEKCFDDNGKRIRGQWRITKFGYDFLERGIGISAAAITYRGVALAGAGSIVTFADQAPLAYKQREEYAMDAEPLT